MRNYLEPGFTIDQGFAALQDATNRGFASLLSTMEAGFTSLRTSMEASFAAVDREISQLRADVEDIKAHLRERGPN